VNLEAVQFFFRQVKPLAQFLCERIILNFLALGRFLRAHRLPL